MSDQPVIYLTDDTDAQRLAAAAGASRSLPGSDRATAALYDWGRRLWIWVLTRQVDWDRLAGTLVREQVERLHKESTSGRHPFHPEVLGRIDQLALEVSDRLMASDTRADGTTDPSPECGWGHRGDRCSGHVDRAFVSGA